MLMRKLLYNKALFWSAAAVVAVVLAVFLSRAFFMPAHGGDTAYRLERADSLKYVNPQEALRVLRLVRQDGVSRDADGARYALCVSMASVLSGRPLLNDSLISVALDYYSYGDDSLRKAETYYAAAITYRSFDDDKRALSYFNKAGTALQGCSSFSQLGYLLFRDWGLMLKAEKPYNEAMSMLSRAERYAVGMRDTAKIIEMRNLIGYEMMFMGDMDGALRQFVCTSAMAEASALPQQIAESFKNKAVANKYMGRLPQALESIDRAIACGGYSDMRKLYSVKGSVLADMGRLDSARHYMELSRKADHYYDMCTYYLGMSQIAKKQGLYAEALSMHEKYALYMDSTFEQMRGKKLSEMQRLYNYSVLRAERNALLLESNRLENTLLAILLSAVILIFVSLLLYRRWKSKMQSAIASKDNLLRQSISQIKDKNYELMLMQQNFRDREAELTYSLMGKEEELGRLRERQKELKMRIFELDEVVEKIGRTRRMNEKKKILSSSEIALSDGERTSLLESADLCFDDFVVRLRRQYPLLTVDDLCLCCLMRMHISNQDICILLALNDYTLRKRKYRMKTVKLGLTVGEVSLEDFIAAY